MSVKFGLMALLAEQPAYGAKLRADFETRTGGTWPLNVGQVYTTLGRLERDGLVEQAGPADAEGRIPYRLTEAGTQQVRDWWDSPVARETTPRDELVIKLALAVTAPGVDVQAVAQRQRTATLRHLRDLTKLKQSALEQVEQAAATGDGEGNSEMAWLLVLDNLIFGVEAEVRWLDHVETRLARQASNGRRSPASDPASQSSQTTESNQSGAIAEPAEPTGSAH